MDTRKVTKREKKKQKSNFLNIFFSIKIKTNRILEITNFKWLGFG